PIYAGITLMQGYDRSHLQLHPDLVIVGNAMKRGIDAVEYMLNEGLPYISGPQFLAVQVLQGKHVLGVAGTHGKPTTTTMLAWVLDQAGLEPGFLIGGVPLGFSESARLGGGKYFCVEADEYDSAFFDKRSKFVHYHPRTAILNNLEFDHADIFADLAAIQTQFHHFVRLIPQSGRIIRPAQCEALDRVLERGCWSEVSTVDGPAGWHAHPTTQAHVFAIFNGAQWIASLDWPLTGAHNRSNALAAIAAAAHIGVDPKQAIAALQRFQGVKRRMELRGTVRQISVYDDFAHHPTAIAPTLEGLRARAPEGRILAVLEPRSNTMKLGAMKARLADSLRAADLTFCYAHQEGKHALGWDPREALAPLGSQASVHTNIDALIQDLVRVAQAGDRIVAMSNGGFQNIHQRLLDALEAPQP